MPYSHIPAMREEVLEYLDCRPGMVCVDGTLGGAGHAQALCERIMPDGLLIGIDQDADAVANAAVVLHPWAAGVRLFRENFSEMGTILAGLGIAGVDGILLDLGLSQNQLEASGRGFSFQRDEPLDMRMDTRVTETAADLVNRLKENELRDLFHTYGEERFSGRIARRIVAARRLEPIRTSGALSRLVCEAVPGGRSGRARIHPATRVFQALRIAVNRELERLETTLDQVPGLLNPGGRVCVLSFHSLEDRIVKHRLRAFEKGPQTDVSLPVEPKRHRSLMRVLTKKVVRPGAAEIAAEPHGAQHPAAGGRAHLTAVVT